MAYDKDQQSVQATIADLSATGDKVTFTPVFPSEIVEFGVIITTVVVGTGMIFKCDKRVTAGTDTGRGDGDLGTLTPAIAAAVGTKQVSRPTNPGTVVPGQQAILELTTGATSGAGIGFITFREKPVYRDAVDNVKTA